jgi:hypothetical protein
MSGKALLHSSKANQSMETSDSERINLSLLQAFEMFQVFMLDLPESFALSLLLSLSNPLICLVFS